MRVGNAHLTYCTNIHAGESWAEVRRDLERHTLAVKRRVCPDAPFGVGLRLSARAAQECDVDELRRFLDGSGMYVFTINGFPYGPFHGEPVKERVYDPDWTTDERVAYTQRLAAILSALLPDGMDGSISTVPLHFEPWPGTRNQRVIANPRIARCVENLVATERYLAELAARTGKRIVLALEPEPSCALETARDAAPVFALLDNVIPGHRHLALCLDACHAAVEFDELAAWRGLPIAKVQLSCGLRVEDKRTLAPFAEGVYLHQTVARAGTELRHYDDLPEALSDARPADEWRVHFHVPIFHGGNTTRDFLEDVLAAHKRQAISTHLEVETYTWDVLPPHLRDRPIDEAIAAELQWVLARL